MMPNSPLPPPSQSTSLPRSPKGRLWARGWQEIAAEPQLSRALSWQLFTRNAGLGKDLRDHRVRPGSQPHLVTSAEH